MKRVKPAHRWGERVGLGAALVVGALALIVLARLVKVPAAPPGIALGEYLAPGLTIARRDRLAAEPEAAERLWLLDPGPLFLPTRNEDYLEETRVGASRQGGVAAQDFPAALYYPATAPAREILRSPSLGGAAEVAARLVAPRWFAGLGRREDSAGEPPSPRRVARVEIHRQGHAERVAALDIAQADGLSSVSWVPFEIRVVVDDIGLVGAPLVVVSSGADEIDERIRSIVGNELLPTLRLRAGIYRLEVGP